MKWDRKRELRRAFDAPMPGGKREFLARIGKKEAGFGRLLAVQFYYMQKSTWVLNILLFLGTVGSGRMLNIWESRRNLGILLLWLPFWSLLLFREELRCGIYRMEELERSCAYSALEVLVSRLFWTGALQLLLLGASGILLADTAEEWFAILIYFPVPWLASSLLSLLAIPACGRQQALWCCIGVSALVSILLAAAVELCPQIYEAGYLAGWLAAAVCLAALNGVQIRKFRKNMEESIWSLQ